MDAKINDFSYLFEKGEEPRNYLKTNRILRFRHAKRCQESIENRCKIFSKSVFGGSWKTCCERVWKLFPKSVPRGPQRRSKSIQNPFQDHLGTLLGPSLVFQIWAGVSRGGPRRFQGVPVRPQ